MKRKISFICLTVLALSLAIPTISYSISSSTDIKQISRGDKKVHHPVHINSKFVETKQIF